MTVGVAFFCSAGPCQAAADGGVLEMRHLVQALFLEGKKEGKVRLASEFGEYGYLLQPV